MRIQVAVSLNMQPKFSKILQEKFAGKNLSKVARELDISKSLLADWVSARRLPSFRNMGAVSKLANYLGMTLEQLLVGEEPKTKVISSVSFEDDSRSYKINVERLK